MTYKICKKCIMDSSDPDIVFNEDIICNHCTTWQKHYDKISSENEDNINVKLKQIADSIKKRAGSSKYHCILGMSGGIDSSFTANLIVEKMGLNPLIVHFDNGWNSILAVDNIKKIITKLNLDMITYVIDWEEFKDLQRAFLYASVIDIEMLTDNAIYGTTINIAKKHRIKSIISGDNLSTESGLPNAWRWEKLDAKNIKSIHRKFGTLKLDSFPLYGPWNLVFNRLFNNISYFYPLNVIKYSKTNAIQLLKDKFDWQDYGGKHYESFFTKFYQAYILPTKFKVNKKRAHLSSLIRNEEISREEALVEISKPLYDNLDLKNDMEYIFKKLDFTLDEFNELMLSKPNPHTTFPSDLKLLTNFKNLALIFKKIKNIAI